MNINMDANRNTSIIRLSYYMMAIAIVLIVGMLLSASSSSSVGTGWIAVVGASVVFGSTGIPMKIKATMDTTLEPVIFALFSGIGIFIVNFPLTVYLLVIKKFEFQPWAFLGSLDIVGILCVAFLAVKELGYTKAPAFWCSIGIVSSFLIGTFFFGETIHSYAYAIFSLPLLIGGIVAVVSCKPAQNVDKDSKDSCSKSKVSSDQSDAETGSLAMNELDKFMTDKVDENSVENGSVTRTDPVDDTDSVSHDGDSSDGFVESDEEILISVNRKNFDHTKNHPQTNFDSMNLNYVRFVKGSLFCIITGLLDGSLMVPFKLSKSTNLRSTFCYLSSFGLSSGVISVLLFIVYYAYSRKQTFAFKYLEQSMTPGILSGILWATANFMSVHATYYLGMKVAFPLTQTCVVFSALWGLLYFHELDALQHYNGLRLSVGITLILAGAYFLVSAG